MNHRFMNLLQFVELTHFLSRTGIRFGGSGERIAQCGLDRPWRHYSAYLMRNVSRCTDDGAAK
ncbi:MAG: hypothetical protein ACR65Z_04215 [Methylocystis sp.]